MAEFTSSPNQHVTTTASFAAAPNRTNSYCSDTMSSKIFLSICPLLLLFGTFTNIFSLLVLSRKRMRKHSTYVYLAILSVIDLMALWLGITRDYLAHGYGIYIKSALLCKIHSFLFYFTLDLSSWILVAVSLDRFFAITFIFSAYTRKLLLKIAGKPKFICSILCGFFFILNLHFVFFVELDAGKQQIDVWPAEAKATRLLDVSEVMDKLKLAAANQDTSGGDKSKLFSYYYANSRKMKFDHAIYASNSIIEFNDNINNNQSAAPIVLVMPGYPSSSGGGGKSESEKSSRRHSIGVFDEYFYCVMDEAKNPTYVRFFVNIWPFIDLSMYAILPFCIMFLCNIAIIKNVTFSSADSLNSKFKLKNKKMKK
jgi:hypothetical protein